MQPLPRLALGVGVLSLLAACLIISPKKPFWYDELTSYYLTLDNSPTHMLQAIAQNVDTAPPLYHLLGWFWMRLSGESVFSLRLFSSVGMCAAFILVFLLLADVYQHWVAFIASALVFLLSDLILVQNAEARFYGLYMALCTAAVLLYQQLGKQAVPSRRLLLLNVGVHGALVLTHYVGFLYSGAILLAFVVRDLMQRSRHVAIYLSVIAGWALFLVWLGPFINQFSMVRPYNWIPRPDVFQLIFFCIWGISIHIIACLLVFGIAGAVVNRQRVPLSAGRASLRIVGICLLLVPIFDWIVSQFVTSVFIARYMLPTAIGWAILLADVLMPTLNLLLEARSSKTKLFIPIIGLLVIIPIIYAVQQPTSVMPDAANQPYREQYAGLPIFTTSPHRFVPHYYYATSSGLSEANDVPYYFVLDWDAALNPLSAKTAPSSYKLMEALKAAYPQIGQHILDLPTLLVRYNRFLILNDGLNAWPELHLKDSPAYKWQVIGESDGIPMILVERRAGF